MVRRKTAASSVALTVFRDEPEASLSGDNGDGGASHHLPPPRKKTRLDMESPIAATAPRTRRAALKEKATNPSSSDNSFLRSIDTHGLFHEKVQKGKRKALPNSDTTKAPDLGKDSVRSAISGASFEIRLTFISFLRNIKKHVSTARGFYQRKPSAPSSEETTASQGF